MATTVEKIRKTSPKEATQESVPEETQVADPLETLHSNQIQLWKILRGEQEKRILLEREVEHLHVVVQRLETDLLKVRLDLGGTRIPQPPAREPIPEARPQRRKRSLWPFRRKAASVPERFNLFTDR